MHDDLPYLEPEASSLCIKIEESIDEEGQPYIDVYGIELTQTERHPGVKSAERYGLDLVMWPEWLGMRIDESTIAEYGEKATLCHCLYELAFYGHTLNEVIAHRNEVMLGI